MARGKYLAWLKPDKLALLTNWARKGLVDEDIAKNIGISRSTLYEWKNRCPDISDALNTGAREADAVVENALYKRATGFRYKEVITETDAKGETRIREIEKEVPPDTTAQIFWLKNRMPDLWRDKVQTELGGKVEHIDRMPDEDKALMQKVVERLESYRSESADE